MLQRHRGKRQPLPPRKPTESNEACPREDARVALLQPGVAGILAALLDKLADGPDTRDKLLAGSALASLNEYRMLEAS